MTNDHDPAGPLGEAGARHVASTHGPDGTCSRCGYTKADGHHANCIHYDYWKQHAPTDDRKPEGGEAGARLRALVAELVAKLDAVRNDPQYIGVWTLAHIHGYNYTGLTYTNELQAVKDALLSAPVVPDLIQRLRDRDASSVLAEPRQLSAPVVTPRFTLSELRQGEENNGPLQSTDIFLEASGVSLLVNVPVGSTATYSLLVDGLSPMSGQVLSAPVVSPPQGEIAELKKELAIVKLSIPLEEELAAKINEMCKYLAMGQSFTLNGIARLLIECQRRMASDWTEIGNLRRELKTVRAVSVSPHDYRCQVSAKARGELSDAICTCGLAYAVERIAREPRGPMVVTSGRRVSHARRKRERVSARRKSS